MHHCGPTVRTYDGRMENEAAKHDAAPQNGNAFPPTAWTLVQQAGGGDAASRDPALNELAQRYWRPIYAYLRYSGRAPADAEDLTQGFFIHLLEKDLLARVKLRQVRFRAFLRSVLENFLANTARTASAQKRSAGFTFDVNEVEPHLAACGDATPDAVFDHIWAVERLETAMTTLRSELRQSGREWVAAALLDRVGPEPASVADLAQSHGITENQLSVALHRARQRLRELLLADLARSTTTAEEAADELAAMFTALGNSTSPRTR